MANEFRRKNIRLPQENYVGRKLYFVTLCFKSRRPFGADAKVANWLIDRLQKHAARLHFFVHAYCIMPDHIHVLVDAASDDSNLIDFVHSYKQETAFESAQRNKQPLWQFKYYDRILRQSDPPERVAWYIWMNPVRKRICKAPLEYPFLGSFTAIGAKLLNSTRAPEWAPPWKNIRT